MRLKISDDRNFTRDYRSLENAGNGTRTTFEAVLWYWRLSFGDATLSTGRFTVANRTGPELVNPVKNSVFRYHDEPPRPRFEWSAKPEVSHYILEISETRDFARAVSRPDIRLV